MSDSFWQLPPWQERRSDGGLVPVTRKQRLGLRPIPRDHWFLPDADLLAHKRAQLIDRYDEVVAMTPDLVLPPLDAWALPVPVSGDVAWHPFVNHFAGVAEDVCLLDARHGFRLVAACLCAPSYWRLEDKLGQPLRTVHEPVEGMNARIGTRVERFLAEMPVGQPFCRRNWFVHGAPLLYHPAPETAAELGEDPAGWWFRSERQVLYKPDAAHVLFTLSISHAPVAGLAGRSGARNAFVAALAGMDQDEIAHFGGVAKYARLQEYVTRL